jgi:hypothetical protein
MNAALAELVVAWRNSFHVELRNAIKADLAISFLWFF